MSACQDIDLSKQIAYFKTLDPKIVKVDKSFSHLQYDFFLTEAESELEMLQKKVAKIEFSAHAVRRGTYALINEQRKRIEELESRLQHIERGICYGK